jgi:hypothetical protein
MNRYYVLQEVDRGWNEAVNQWLLFHINFQQALHNNAGSYLLVQIDFSDVYETGLRTLKEVWWLSEVPEC